MRLSHDTGVIIRRNSFICKDTYGVTLRDAASINTE